MKWNKRTVTIGVGILFAAIAFNWALNHLTVVGGALQWIFRLIAPFLLGAAIAFIINVPMRRIEKTLFNEKSRMPRALRRLTAYLLTLLIVITVIGLAFFVIIPQIGESMRTLMDQIPDAIDSAQRWLIALAEKYPDLAAQVLTFDFSQFNLNLEQFAAQLADNLKNWAQGLVGFGVNAIGSVVGAVTNFFIGFIFSIYLLLQKEKLAGQCRQILYGLLPESAAERILEIAHLTNRTFSSFLSGQCTEAVILGTLFFISMTLLRMPYALMIGVLIAITALVPIVGAFIGCIVGAFLILIVNPMQALFFVILFLVLQQVEGNLIYPHVVGNSVGLPSIWVLVAVTIGGKLMGVAGMLLFIPLCSVCYALFRTFIKDRLREKGVPASKLSAKDTETPPASCEDGKNQVK